MNNDFGITVLVHELEYCISLDHTNWKELLGNAVEINIHETPTIDKAFLMNGSVMFDAKPTFNNGDKKAIKMLYKDMDAICKGT